MIETEPIILQNSPIEFVLVGLLGGDDSILVKSSNAGLDLIGLVGFRPYRSSYLPSNNSLISNLIGASRQLNLVKSRGSLDLDQDVDSRRSHYRFAWVGNATYRDKGRIEEMFNDILASIKITIKANAFRDIELIFGGIVLECSIANQRKIKSRKSAQAVLALYALMALYALYYFLERYGN